ncbi:MAG TPA: tyrosine-type recombinase/integrase [Candidatus Dormibacteraeota bacterium]|nr:tyrosine-type recombinase/integrase [Candidatus Dormibacteraeota bacterium]
MGQPNTLWQAGGPGCCPCSVTPARPGLTATVSQSSSATRWLNCHRARRARREGRRRPRASADDDRGIGAGSRRSRGEDRPPSRNGRLSCGRDGDPLEALCTVAQSLGLRQGEALGLSVDYEARVIRITHGLQKDRREACPGSAQDGKESEGSDDADRRKSCVAKARTSSAAQASAGGRSMGRYRPGLHDATGTPLEGTSVTTRLQERLSKAGLPRMKFHELRHSAASLLTAQGVPLRTVMDVLGHSTVTLTANTHGHLYDEAPQEAAQAMDRALGQLGSLRRQGVK